MSWTEEFYRAFFVAFGMFEIITNLSYLLLTFLLHLNYIYFKMCCQEKRENSLYFDRKKPYFL